MADDRLGVLPIHRLSVARAFDGLSAREQLYAHHLAKAAWSGTRIILRQVSPESNTVFDLIMQLYKTCKEQFRGEWHLLADACQVSQAEVNAFVQYAATFLSNVGNYFVGHSLSDFPRRLELTFLGFRGSKVLAVNGCKISAGYGKYLRASQRDLCEHRGAHVLFSTQQPWLPQ